MRTDTIATLKLIESGIRTGLRKPELHKLKKRKLIQYGGGNTRINITTAGRERLWHEALIDTMLAGRTPAEI